MTKLPENITLDLDSEVREDAPEPFVVTIKGRPIPMTDPEEIDWQDLLEIEHPVDFLRHCVSEEDRKYILEQEIPGWKFGRLMEAYQKHFRLDKKMREHQRAQRQGR